MLENLVRSSQLGDATAIRAALYLARDHGRQDLCRLLGETARSPRREALRGLAAAALFDAGDRELPLELIEQLEKSRKLPNLAWAGLLRAAALGHMDDQAAGLADDHVGGRRPSAGLADYHVGGRRPSAGLADRTLVTEPTFRWIQLGWVE
jgi:hypothetical protein